MMLRQIVILVLVFAAATAGYLLSDCLDESKGKGHDSKPERSLTELMPHDGVVSGSQVAVEDQPVLNTKLVDFALPDLGGNVRNTKEWQGKPLIINFWATWCPPCRKELPLLIEFQKQRPTLNVLGVAMNSSKEVRDYAAKENFEFNFTNLVGQTNLKPIYATTGNPKSLLPYTIAVDAQGQIVYTHFGELKKTHLVDILQALSIRSSP